MSAGNLCNVTINIYLPSAAEYKPALFFFFFIISITLFWGVCICSWLHLACLQPLPCFLSSLFTVSSVFSHAPSLLDMEQLCGEFEGPSQKKTFSYIYYGSGMIMDFLTAKYILSQADQSASRSIVKG